MPLNVRAWDCPCGSGPRPGRQRRQEHHGRRTGGHSNDRGAQVRPEAIPAPRGEAVTHHVRTGADPAHPGRRARQAPQDQHHGHRERPQADQRLIARRTETAAHPAPGWAAVAVGGEPGARRIARAYRRPIGTVAHMVIDSAALTPSRPAASAPALPSTPMDFTEAWLRNRRLSEHTRDAYRRDVAGWLALVRRPRAGPAAGHVPRTSTRTPGSWSPPSTRAAAGR